MMKLKTVEKYFEENPDVTILGFAWSCYWRLTVAFFAGYFALIIPAIIIAGMIDVLN